MLIKSQLAIAISTALLTLPYATMASAESTDTKSISPKNAKPSKDLEIIEVKGVLRKSYEGAVGVKRLADTVVDAITAEDIGQFTDQSIAGAMQRIPGVQIETDDAGTDGDRISIRGLGPEFVNSTINGRRLLSSGNEAKSLRKMNFNIFPSSVLAGVQVAKGQTASRPESGLAGQVDISTLRPLSINKLEDNNFFGVVTAKGIGQDISNDVGWRLESTLGWRNDDSTVGAYLAIVQGNEKNARDQIRVNYETGDLSLDTTGDGQVDSVIHDAMYIKNFTLNPIRETPERTTIATGIEYQPNEDINLLWDLMFSRYHNNSTRNRNQIITRDAWSEVIFNNSESNNLGLEIDENNVVRRADFTRSNQQQAIVNDISAMRFDNHTDNLITGINIELNHQQWRSNIDLYYSDISYRQNFRFGRVTKDLPTQQFVYDTYDRIPNITSPAAQSTDGYEYLRSQVRQIKLGGDNFGLTYSANYEVYDSTIASVDLGVHHDKTSLDVKRYGPARFTSSAQTSANIVANALSGEVIDQDFLANDDFSPARWLYLDYNAINDLDPNLNASANNGLTQDPLSSYMMDESISALWTQLNIDTEYEDWSVTGNIGVRAVQTSNKASAAQVIDDNQQSPVTSDTSDWQILPSLNFNIGFTRDVALRLAASKTLSRPDYEQLAPITTITTFDEGVNEASRGNPELKPMTAHNYDITLEYYNELDGAFVFSAFYKDVFDFIVDTTISNGSIEGYNETFELTTPINFSDGHTKGLEIGIYQPLDNIASWLAGFGFSGNYTYVDSSFEQDVGDAGFGFPGSSKNNVNLIGFFDSDNYSVRLAYTYRSDFFRSLAGTGSQTNTARFTQAQENLDLNVTLRPSDSVNVVFNVTNLTKDSRRDYIANKTTFLDYFDKERTYTLAVSYKF